ncbi:MFS transporter [Halopseudomonas sp.]|uniref:MFS transporter n=1 Tax=Halopseudomonas sp. TaxID=2901191 RepID=UPI0030032190
MFNESEYQTVWLVYLAAAAGCWLVWWQLTGLIKWWFIHEPLWIIMAVLLFTPTEAEVGAGWQAPAFLIYLLDTLLDTGDNQARMLGELSLVMTLAFAVYLVFVGLRALYHHWRKQDEPAVSDT